MIGLYVWCLKERAINAFDLVPLALSVAFTNQEGKLASLWLQKIEMPC